MADMLTSGVSGLNAFRRALDVIGSNISNANTPGYTRQTVALATRNASLGAGGFLTEGVDVVEITRVANSFLQGQIQLNASIHSKHETFLSHSSLMDKLLSGQDSSVSPQLNQFFSTLNQVANTPTNPNARNTIIADAKTLTSRIKAIDTRFSSEVDDVNRQLTDSVKQINLLTESIASINTQIKDSTAVAGGLAPNELLDEREQLLKSLSEYMNIRTEYDNGNTKDQVSIFVANGQSLVNKGVSQTLATVTSSNNGSFLNFAVVQNDTTVELPEITGGSVGGLMSYRKEILAEGRALLDKFSLGLAEVVNQQHRLGLDTNGNLGQSFFTDMNSTGVAEARSLSGASNTGNAVLSVTISDINEVTTDEYQLSYVAGTDTYSLRRSKDNTLIKTFTSADLPNTVTTEGITISLDSGVPADGDTFTINPTKGAAGLIDVVVANQNSLATASAINQSVNGSNKGLIDVDIIAIDNQTGTTLPAAPITMTFNANLNQFEASTGETFAYNPATESGKAFTITLAGFADVKFNVSGAPQDLDRFTLQSNIGGVGDGSNANLIAAKLTQKTLDANGQSVIDAYDDVKGTVGRLTAQAKINESASRGLLNQIQAQRDSISGVNTDEEAADMFRFVQAYQAAAQLITTANRLFDILIQATGR